MCLNQVPFCSFWRQTRNPRGGGTFIYNVALIGMGRCEGYGFQAVWSGIGYRNKGVFVQHRIGYQLPEN